MKTDRAWIKFATDITVGTFTKLSNQQVSGINIVIEYTNMIHVIEYKGEILTKSGAITLVNNINKASKLVNIGRRIVIICSLALDALELGLSIEQDLVDADKKIGKKTWVTVGKIVGSWGGYFLGTTIGVVAGATKGAATGAAAGSAAGPVGTITGGIVGFAATLILCEVGEKLGEYIVEVNL